MAAWTGAKRQPKYEDKRQLANRIIYAVLAYVLIGAMFGLIVFAWIVG